MAARKKTSTQNPTKSPIESAFPGLAFTDGEIPLSRLVKKKGKALVPRLHRRHEYFSVGEVASRQDDLNLRAHIRRLGVQQRVLITPRNEILDGRRRVLTASSLGLKKIPVRRIDSPLTDILLFQLAIGIQEQHKPAWSQEAIFRILLEWFGKDFLVADRRANNWKNFSGLPREAEGMRLDLLLAEIWPRYTASGWLDILAKLRKSLKPQKREKAAKYPAYSPGQIKNLYRSLEDYYSGLLKTRQAKTVISSHLRDFAPAGRSRQEREETMIRWVERRTGKKVGSYRRFKEQN